MIIESFINYLLIGFICGYLLIYGLRPAMPYPEFILEPFEHNWLFIIMLIINYYFFTIDIKLGYLMLLTIIALIFDYLIFTKKGKNKNKNKNKKNNNISLDHIHYISNNDTN